MGVLSFLTLQPSLPHISVDLYSNCNSLYFEQTLIKTNVAQPVAHGRIKNQSVSFMIQAVPHNDSQQQVISFYYCISSL